MYINSNLSCVPVRADEVDPLHADEVCTKTYGHGFLFQGNILLPDHQGIS